MSFECMNTITKMVSLDNEIKVSKKEANLSKILSDQGGSVKIDLSRPTSRAGAPGNSIFDQKRVSQLRNDDTMSKAAYAAQLMNGGTDSLVFTDPS